MLYWLQREKAFMKFVKREVTFGDIIFGILIIIATFTLTLFINRPPDHVHVIVDEKGVTKGGLRYPYSTLHSFWIDVEHSHPRLFLRSQKNFMPLIHIPIGKNVDPENLEDNLLAHLPREFHGERWGL